MTDKDKIYFNACLYAIDKLVEKGSRSYCFKTDDGWHSATWGYTIGWILEKLNAESEDTTLDKIRAEIWNLEEGISSYHNDRPWLYKDEVLQIIDKYKKEGEQE